MYQKIDFIYLFHELKFEVRAPKDWHPGSIDLGICFESEKKYSNITGLEFDILVKSNSEIIIQNSFPPPGVIYEMTDNTPLITLPLETKADKDYYVFIDVKYHGCTNSIEYVIPASRPPKPYPSWKWNGEEWEAPVPKKWDRAYNWDEENQVWVEDPNMPPIAVADYEVE